MYKSLIRSLLSFGKPEIVQHSIATALALCSSSKILRIPLQLLYNYNHRILVTKLSKLTFPSPIGLDASYDGEFKLAGAAPSIGFGFVEATTSFVPTQPRTKIQESSLLGNYARKMLQFDRRIPVGVRVMVNAENDLSIVRRVSEHADFLILEIPPITAQRIKKLLRIIKNEVKKPLFVDADQLLPAQLRAVAPHGLVVTGDAIIVRSLYRLTKGRSPIINRGHIQDATDAYNRLVHGASLLLLSTEFLDYGLGIAKDINQQIVQNLCRDGYYSVPEATGTQA